MPNVDPKGTTRFADEATLEYIAKLEQQLYGMATEVHDLIIYHDDGCGEWDKNPTTCLIELVTKVLAEHGDWNDD